jgi:adenine nucleotide transporter 17
VCWLTIVIFTEYAYFFFYSLVRTTYIRSKTASLPPRSKVPSLGTAAELALGALAGALAQIFTIPVAVIATRQQVSTARPPTPEEEASGVKQKTYGFFEVARDIIAEDGVGGLWLGIKPGLVLTVNPAITYGMFERIKSIVLRDQDSKAKLSPWISFTLGALSKSLATVVRATTNLPFTGWFTAENFNLGHISLYHGESTSSGARREQRGGGCRSH